MSFTTIFNIWRGGEVAGMEIKSYLCGMERSVTDNLQYRIRRLELKTSFLSGIVGILIAVVTGIIVNMLHII